MASGVKLSKDWRHLVDTLDPARFNGRLAKATAIAGNRVGRDFQRRARAAIRSGIYAPNSPITVIMKGSSKPLVDRGDLFQGLTYEVDGPYRVRLGILRRSSGDHVVNVGLILHEGATINVRQHPQVRRAVMAKLRDRLGPERMAALNPRQRRSVTSAASSIGMGKRPASSAQRKAIMAKARKEGKLGAPSGGQAKAIWVIPARPFIAGPAGDPGFHRFLIDTYSQAVRAALTV